ncbi:peroxide stress protein YaaA [Sphingomonas bacterium]|uniref:peroxide stress protein YaaA n=1 Tax=Sphingomonas bacterium TaxID=1895847 RepID=UPI0015760E91|nr:peroxide stress protein YaaA [Sphingomonas bacterium]
MIALLSPAKTLDYESPLPAMPPTSPQFAAEADALAKAAARLSAKKLGALMRISPKLAKLNAARFREFAEGPERPAIRAFAGDVYTGFEAKTLDDAGLAFAQDHLRILSGLYGLLRPLDAIRPYRLEMGTSWAPGRKKNLYGWWGARVSAALGTALEQEGSGTILNLASKEYWHVVEQAPPAGARIVTVDFREDGPDGPRFVSFDAKRARGMMARWMCEHHVTEVEGMKGFDSDGYRYDANASEDDLWRFVRHRG